MALELTRESLDEAVQNFLARGGQVDKLSPGNASVCDNLFDFDEQSNNDISDIQDCISSYGSFDSF